MPKAEYRSSIRSKNLIKKALAKLIHEKDIAKITVSDIIREADISRGTFYAHYADVNAVINQIESEELKNLIDFVDKFGFENITINISDFITLICEYLNRDMEYYRMLTQSNILNNFIWRLVNVYYEKLHSEVVATVDNANSDEINLYLIYITSGAKTVILSWLNGEIKGTPEQVGERIGKLVALNQQYFINQ
ncbi:MAG: TetR/AcrR family transcriptional regulator C-terminal domain-containing protein [Clostridia bacterium]|nr:TetR/AcrR family transcriptional regulator C-terminal domain-containing protein [Clostridia bacterium]